MTGVQPLPEIKTTGKEIQLNYGLSAFVARYGRVCMIYINGNVNQNVPAWGVIGRELPTPIYPVITPNCAYMSTKNSYLNLTQDGVLQTACDLSKGGYVQATFTYITGYYGK